jgi:hypothetical protein
MRSGPTHNGQGNAVDVTDALGLFDGIALPPTWRGLPAECFVDHRTEYFGSRLALAGSQV